MKAHRPNPTELGFSPSCIYMSMNNQRMAVQMNIQLNPDVWKAFIGCINKNPSRASIVHVMRQKDIRFKYFVDARQQNAISVDVISCSLENIYNPFDAINKKINDILAWIVDNVECKWSMMIDGGLLSFSFSDLQTATLFRLRF